jgi:hypothetical protein
MEAAFCDTSKPIWANIAKHGAGPRVDAYMFVSDTIGMQVWLDAGQEKTTHYPSDGEWTLGILALVICAGMHRNIVQS